MAGMRSIANLDISLGLISFPVKLYKGTNDPSEGVQFKQVHATCGHPINMVRTCHACETPVEWADLRKGFEYTPGQFVSFTEDEIKALRPEKTDVLKVDGFVASESVDPAYLDGAMYFLSPAAKDHTTFATFREALAGRWAIGKVVMYGRERVAAVRAVDNVLGLHLLRSQAEIRNAHDVPKYAAIPDTVKPEYAAMMGQLMDAKTINLDDVVIESDSYVEAVRALVDSRLAGEPAPAPKATPAPAPSDDLMSMLQASLAVAK